MRGLSDLPLVEVPHPVGTLPIEALNAVAASSLDAVISALTRTQEREATRPDHYPAEETTASELSAPRDSSQFFDFVVARGWSDGLPMLPPTRDAVKTMVAAAGLPPETLLGTDSAAQRNGHCSKNRGERRHGRMRAGVFSRRDRRSQRDVA